MLQINQATLVQNALVGLKTRKGSVAYSPILAILYFLANINPGH